MALSLKIASHSETGLVRKNNQDSGYASPQLLVVADGMGGAAAGDLASAVAIDTIRRIDKPIAGEEMLEVLSGAIHKANDRIADLVETDLSLDGMGTTVTGALFDGTQIGLAHIGDSRAYLFRDGQLQQLTHDHSWVQSLVDEGKIDSGEAAVHPHRSLLLKVLNGQPANDPDLMMLPVSAGDRLLLCSDGLSGLVEDPVIEALLQTPDPEEALDCLVQEARSEGGIDNITVIVADVVEGTDPVTTLPVVLGAAAERAIPLPATKIRDDENEDTIISELPIAARTGAAEPDDESRYNPLPPHRRRSVRPLAALVAAVLIAVAALGSAYAWTRTQYFVGVSSEQVAIFKGLSDSLPGIKLSSVYEIQPLRVVDLPQYYQEKVRANIDVSSLSSARQTVGELVEAAERCAGKQSGAASGSRSPSASPTRSPATPSVHGPGSPNPSQPATPSPSPSADPGQNC
ncbi:MAG: pstP [Propionibacteriaceae bacterium]|nr:pstP [Propionibacteriaceae bacterium]